MYLNHINKEIKDKIIKSFSSLGNIGTLGVGLFSAEVGASKLFASSPTLTIFIFLIIRDLKLILIAGVM